MTLAELKVVLSAESAKLRAELKKANDDTREFAASVEHHVGSIKKAFGAAIGVEFGEKLIEAARAAGEFVIKGAELAASAKEIGEALGATTESYSRFQYAARSVGLDNDRVTAGLRVFAKQLSNAREAGSAAEAVFQKMGFSQRQIAELAQGDLTVALDAVADRFASYAANADRAALAQFLWGRGAIGLVPVFAKGAAGLHELYEESDRVGSTLSHEAAEGAHEFTVSINQLHGTFQDLQKLIAVELAHDLKDLAEGFRASATEGGSLRDTAHDIVEALRLIAAGAKLAKDWSPIGMVVSGSGDVASGALHAYERATENPAVRQTFTGRAPWLPAEPGAHYWAPPEPTDADRELWKQWGMGAGKSLADGVREGLGEVPAALRDAFPEIYTAGPPVAATPGHGEGKANAPNPQATAAQAAAERKIQTLIDSYGIAARAARGATERELVDARISSGDLAKDFQNLGDKADALRNKLRGALDRKATAEAWKEIHDKAMGVRSAFDALISGGTEFARVQAQIANDPKLSKALVDARAEGHALVVQMLDDAKAIDSTNAYRTIAADIQRLREGAAALAPEMSNRAKFLAQWDSAENRAKLSRLSPQVIENLFSEGLGASEALDTAGAVRKLRDEFEGLADNLVTAGTEGTKYGEIAAKIERGKLGRHLREQGDNAKYTAAQFRQMAIALDAAETRRALELPRETLARERGRLDREYNTFGADGRRLLSNEQYARGIYQAEERYKAAGGEMTAFTKANSEQIAGIFAENVFDNFSHGVDGMVVDFANAMRKMALQALATNLVRLIFNGTAIGAAFNWIGASLGAPGSSPGLSGVPTSGSFAPDAVWAAAGSPSVTPGRAYVVGEHGPEVFVAPVAGQIIPNAGRVPALSSVDAGPRSLVIRWDESMSHLTVRDAIESYLADERARR